MAIYRKRN